MRVFVTGGSGVLGRATIPVLRAAGHEIVAPAREELDLFDPEDAVRVLDETNALMHLATRIPSLDRMADRAAWQENDRLRDQATRVLVEAALATGTVETFVVPTVTFVYPAEGPVDEDTPLGEVPGRYRSALAAEAEVARFAAAGRRGVVLRLGLLDGPGTHYVRPNPEFGATLHVEDAGRALAAALVVPSGIYNVCRHGERVSNSRFREISGWQATL